MGLSNAMNMGFSFLFDYYRSEAWNENKIRIENDETIKTAVLKRMNSIISCLNGR